METYIGTIKWFYVHQKQQFYGFITHQDLGEVFFHSNEIVDINSLKVDSFVPGTEVIFNYNFEKNCATKVLLLSECKDSNFLKDLFIRSIYNKRDPLNLTKIQSSLLKPIFEYLNGTVSYDDIRLALIFIK